MIKPILTDKKRLSELCTDIHSLVTAAEIIDDLRDTAATLKRFAGLAAPQIGYKKRVILVNVQGKLVAMINPKIIITKGKFSYGNEGCFSVPISMKRPIRVKRWFKIKVEYHNEDAMLVEKSFKSFEARLIQHEIDHLDGKLIG